MKKRIISLLLSAAMIMGLLPVIEMPADAATHDGSTIDIWQTVAPVYNSAILDQIKGDWLSFDQYPSISKASASIGPLFLAEEYQGTMQALGFNNGEIYNLVTTTETRDQATEWSMYYPNWWSSVANNPDVKMRLGGNLINGATMSIYNGDTLLGTNSGTRGKTVSTTKDVSIGGTLKTTGRITNPWVVLIDNNKPELVSVSGGLDVLTLTFDEILRWANGSASKSIGEYTITVEVANAKSGVEWGTITYQATNVSDATMTFTRISDAPPAGNYQITSISGRTNAEKDENFEVFGIVQCYAYSYGTERLGYTYRHLMEYVKNPLKKIAEIKNMSPLSDLAGNALELPSKLDLRSFNIGFDSQAPTLEKVYLSGGMVTSVCEIDKNSWPSDIDLSAVYAGAGDQMYFNLQFSEELRNYASSQKIQLNVLKNGSPVVLGNPTYSSATNAQGETCTVLRFGPFTVESGMTMASGYEDSPIGIVRLSGTYCDNAYNDVSDGIPTSAQQIYLDAAAPTVTAEQAGGKDENGRVNREPTIMLTISDGTGSGVLGLEGQIGLSATTETTVSYVMAITDSLIAPADGEYIYSGTLGGGSVSWQTIPLYSNTRYLHIKLVGAEGSITLEDLKLEYQIPDWAGNTGTSAAALVEPEYAIDEVAPVVTAPQLTIIYTATDASVTGSWSASDYNGADGIITYFQWSDTEPVDYSTGWIEAGKQTNGFLWSIEPAIFSESTSTTLWVYAADASGNRSTIVSAVCKVDLTKASTSFVLESDSQIPTGDPVIRVSSSGKTDGETTQYAYTRATITFNGETYVVVLVPQGETVDLFPITGTVYRVTMNGDAYETATALTAQEFNTIFNAWYGEVTVSFESAYYDLTPLAEGDPDGTYSSVEGNVTFRYAPALDNVHSVSLSDVATEGGEALDGTAESLLFNRTLSGISFTVTMENLLRSEWGLGDVDFERSFAALTNVNTGEEYLRIALSASTEQRITLPAVDYTTGVYELSVTVTSRAGSAATATFGTLLVVDNDAPLNVGVWDAYITPGISLYGSFVPNATYFDENGDPILTIGNSGYIYDHSLYTINKMGDRLSGTYIEDLTLNMSGKAEVVRSDTFTTEVSGIYNFGFTISADNEVQELGGHEIGGIQAIYIWNPAVHTSREDGIVTTDSSYTYRSADSLWLETWVVDETTGIGSSTPNMTEDGYYAMAEGIWLKPGSNTICYQVVMKNGLESPVYQLNITTTTAAPTAQLSMDVVEAKITLAEDGQPTNIMQADISLQNVFAANGTHQIYYITKDSKAIINGESHYYSSGDTLELLKTGHFNDKYGIHVSETNIERHNSLIPPTTEYVFGNPSYELYKVRPVGENAVVTIVDDGDEVYNTTVDRSESEYVTYKMDVYSAAGAFLIIDESGGTTLVFPQLAMEDEYGDTAPAVDGYAPRYALLDTGVGFYIDLSVDGAPNAAFGYCDFEARISNSTHLDETRSAMVFTDPMTGAEVARLDIQDPIENTVGYTGGTIYYDGYWYNGSQVYKPGHLSVSVVNPVADGVTHQVGETVESFCAHMELYDANWGRTVSSREVTVSGLYYVTPHPTVTVSDSGVTLKWTTYVKAEGASYFSNKVTLPIFKNGSYTISFTDAWGNVFTDIPFEVTGFDGPEVTVSTVNGTAQAVTVTIQIPEGSSYDSVTVTADMESAVITGNNTGFVTVTLTENAVLTIEWPGNSKTVTISNILPAEPTVIWSFGEDVSEYGGGDVTAYVVDASGNWDLVDPLTGEMPMITFTAGGATSYTFTSISNGEKLGENVYFDLGSFTVTLPEGLVLTAPVFSESPELTDETAPSVQLVPYAMQNSLAVARNMTLKIEETAELADGETLLSMPNPALTAYDDCAAYADPYAFTEALGWASCFRFQIEVQDLSAAKIIVKDGLYADLPSYDDESENVEHVMLSGSTLDVSGPAQFTIFVIDSAGNCVTIPMDLYNIGTAPVPTYTKTYTTVGEDSAIRLTLTAPAGGTDIAITTVDGSAASEAVFTQNGTYTIGYAYLYQGESVSGTLRVTVTEIDNEPPSLLKAEWSANKTKQVNQAVTVTLTFNKDIARVQSTLAEVPNTVEVLISGNRVTIRYSDNTEALSLYFYSINGKRTETPVELDSVTNIDRTAPAITVSEPELSRNGKQATITFTANETVSFREGSRVGTEFTRIVKANGTYTYTFTDAAGNSTTVEVTVDQLIDTPLTMQFNTIASDTGAVTSPDELGQMQVGDTFYVKLSRDATVFFNRETFAVAKDIWTEVTLGDKSGGAIMATDSFGNTVSAVFTNITYPDMTAPTLIIKKDTVYVSLQDLSGLEEALLANAEAVDDRAGQVTVTAHYEQPTAAGTYEVIYRATDAAGNMTEVTGKLRVYADDMPLIYINGEVVERDAIYIAQSGDELVLTVDMNGEPYRVVWKKGIKTVAQMKIGVAEIELTEDSATLPFSGQPGYYTICVTTQDHDQYRVVIYVK